ncbi:MAG: hypothetical protein FWD79_08315 [Desulfobulbus sp.]|nr:hypothetical protein [Desulfobulbus sp.]
MLYVERDAQGAIAAIHRGGGEQPGREPASLLDAEVLAFLKSNGEMETLDLQLMSSDAAVVRVLEDLVDVLIAKKLILITDLPPQAREKILSRKQLRAQMADQQLMVDDIL